MALQKIRHGDLKVWRLALVEYLYKCFVSLLVECNADLNLLIELAERLEHLEPVEVRVVLAECPRKVICVSLPLENLRFINWLLFQWVARLV